MRSLLRRLVRSRILWSLAAALTLYAAAGFLLAPWAIERYLPRYAEQHLGERATVGAVRVNPFLLTVEMSDFSLGGRGEDAILRFDRLFIDFDAASIVNRAWTFSDLHVSGASVGVEIDREGRVNLLELFARLQRPDAPPTPLPALILARIAIEGGRLTLVDRSGASPARAAVGPIEVQVRDLSTLDKHRGRHTLVAALPEGGTLRWTGETALQPMALEGEIALQGLKLATVWPFVRDRLAIAEPQGELTANARYTYDGAQGAFAFRDVQAQIAGLQMALRGRDTRLVALKSVALENAALSLATRELKADALRLTSGEMSASVAEDGVLDWTRLVAPNPAADAFTETAAREGAPWHVALDQVAVEDIALQYTDASRPERLQARIAGLDGALKLELTTAGETPRLRLEDLRAKLRDASLGTAGADPPPVTLASFALTGGRVDTGERIFHAAGVALSGAHAELARDRNGPTGLLRALTHSNAPAAEADVTTEPWRIRLDDFAFDKFALRWRDGAASPVVVTNTRELKGRFRVQAIAGGEQGHVIAENIELAVEGMRVTAPGAQAPLATVASLSLDGGRVDTAAHAIGARSVRLRGADLTLARDAKGPVGLLRVLMPDAAAKAPAAPAATAAAPAWTYRIDTVTAQAIKAALADRTTDPAVAYDLHVESAVLQGVDSASGKPIAFKAALRVNGEGRVSGSGTLAQDFGRATAEIEARAIALEPLEPLIARHALLDLRSGTAGAVARVEYNRTASPMLTAQGRATLDRLHLDETLTGDRFVAWKSLAAEDVRLTVAPDALAIGEVRVVEPGMKLVIAKDRSVNLVKVLRETGTQPAEAPAPEGAPARAEAPAFAFDIDRITVENGTLDFADLSLILPFATRVHALGGSVANLSSDPAVRATLALAGRVDEYGEAHAKGSLLPREPTEYLDITARFENVLMPTLTPYSATFAGRKIEAGRLWLTLEYKIADTQLAGENRIVVDDFRLGERVEAPDALDLPLDLAVALLKDSEGKIRLAVPVRGDVDNPEFDYGEVIRTAVGNAIGRIVTAPFRMLGGLFGGGKSDELREIAFEPGSARIAPPEREKLDALAKALNARPQLKLVVRGPYDAARDGEELRRRHVRQAIATRAGEKIDVEGPVAYASADTQKALEAIVAETAGAEAMGAFARAYAKRTGREPQRVNLILGALGRGSRDLGFYERLHACLVATEQLPEAALRTLAEQRMQAIIAALEKAGVSGARLQTAGIAPAQAKPDGSVRAQFALETGAGT